MGQRIRVRYIACWNQKGYPNRSDLSPPTASLIWPCRWLSRLLNPPSSQSPLFSSIKMASEALPFPFLSPLVFLLLPLYIRARFPITSGGNQLWLQFLSSVELRLLKKVTYPPSKIVFSWHISAEFAIVIFAKPYAVRIRLVMDFNFYPLGLLNFDFLFCFVLEFGYLGWTEILYFSSQSLVG